MKKILSYFKPYKAQAVLGPLFKLLEATFELLVPFVVAAIVDKGFGVRVDGAYPHADKGYIIGMCGVLAAFGLFGFRFQSLDRTDRHAVIIAGTDADYIEFFQNSILHSFTAAATVTPFFAVFGMISVPPPQSAARSQTLPTPTVFRTNSDSANSPGTAFSSSAV